MYGYWRDPIKLSKIWSLALRLTQLLAPLGLGALSAAITFKHNPDWIYWAFIAASVISAIAFAVQWYIDNSGCVFIRYVEAALEMANRFWEIPPKDAGGPAYRFRITLFELTSIPRWRFRKRKKYTHVLVARARFPKAGRRPKRHWYVHHHEEEACQGVAGRIFGLQTVVFTPTLPDLHAKPQPSPADFDRYAKLTYTSEGALRKDPPYSRIIGGMPVQHQDGRRWGVLVFDAPIEGAISDKNFMGDTVVEVDRFIDLLQVILHEGTMK